jgi:hypothetical protein
VAGDGLPGMEAQLFAVLLVIGFIERLGVAWNRR